MALRCSSTAAAARAPAAAAAPLVQAALRRAAPAALAGAAGIRTGSLVQRLPLRALTVAAAAQPEQPAAAAAAAEEPPAKEYVIVNFYHLVDIERPYEVINQHKAWMEGKDVRGRIYISEQGINAQYGGVKEDAVGYAQWLEQQPMFKGLFYTVWPVTEHMYPRLRLKYRPNLISLAGGMKELPITKPEARAIPTPPAEWKRMLSEGATSGKPPLVLDVRNSYEWDAGHFVGAERPLEDNFHETPTEALPTQIPPYLENADPDQPVMIYCTGGIRCDVYGTYLRQKGFNKLYTLEGGIQNYMRTEGLDHWNGSLFVFDGRMAIRPNKDEEAPLAAAAPCSVCGAEAVLPHMNCANIDCNKLFIACDACKTKFKGCCCEACQEAPRLLRPAKTRGLYGNWSEYAEEEQGTQAMALGRGEGRISRRRKRQQAMKVREQAKRAVKVERRHRAKELMAAAEQRGEVPPPGGAAEQAERLARLERLRELRERLAGSRTQQAPAA